MCVFFALILACLALSAWALRVGSQDRGDMIGRLPTMVGVTLTIGSFAFLSWIKFAPVTYLFKLSPELLGDYFGELVTHLLREAGLALPALVLKAAESLAALPGWLLAFIIPTTGLSVRLVILWAPLTAVLALLWLPISFFLRSGSAARRTAGVTQLIMALLAALALLLKIPEIDALGAATQPLVRLLSIISGARMTFPVWLAWAGLLLIAVGGFWEAAGVSPSDETQIAAG